MLQPWQSINLDLESNNLLAPMLDYSSMPYKLNKDARLWCISLRCTTTNQVVLLLPPEVLKEKAPVKVEEYFSDEPEYEVMLNDDGVVESVTTGRLVKTVHKRIFKDADDNVMYEEIQKSYKEDSSDEYQMQSETLEDGIAYNLVNKRVLSYDMMKTIFANCTEVSGHNIVSFDLPVLKLFGILDYKIGYPEAEGSVATPSTFFGKEIKIVDTLIQSKLLNPDTQDAYGRHSLDAWGKRLGVYKQNFHAFDHWSWNMGSYCLNDTLCGTKLFLHLKEEMSGWNWALAYSMEIKLMDLQVSQEHFGFNFDKDLAEWCLEDLDQKLTERAALVEPSLPPKPLNKGELKHYTPPSKQILKNCTPNSFINRFAEKHGATIEEVPREGDEGAVDYVFKYKEKVYNIPFTDPLETSLKTNIKDNDQVKGYLLSLNWEPTEWSERDLTKNSQKQLLTKEKVLATIKRYSNETLESIYQKQRLEYVGVRKAENLEEMLLKAYNKSPHRPLKVITSPKLRVGTNKDLCPNLSKIDKDPEFVQAIVEWHTYTHRRNSISGGSIDEDGSPQKGFLSFVREDGRVATPADTLGTSTFRYTHKNICNISRVSSLYGNHMRGMFGSGEDYYQLGYDAASLEARVQAHYIYDIDTGKELGISLLAEKPNDVHTLNALKLGISRDEAKSITYALLYGAAAPKLQKMLGLSPADAEKMYNAYWDAVPSLKSLRDRLTAYWEGVDKDHIVAIDGRKLRARSPHSLINLLLQAAGAILMKWAVVRTAQLLEEQNLLGNAFEHSKEDVKVFQMIVYHKQNCGCVE